MCKCYAKIDNTDPRVKIWQEIVPNLEIPLKHPIRRDGFLSGDPDRLSVQQKTKLIELMVQNFPVTRGTILNDLLKGILPVKDQNIIISICREHLLAML